MDPTKLFPYLFGGSMVFTIIVVILSVVVSLLCTILPFVAIFGFIRQRSRQKQSVQLASQRWISATGRVLKSRVEVSGGDYSSVSPYVLYEFETNGRVYQNTQIRVGDRYMRSGSSRDAAETVDRYPAGGIVTIYYDPGNPAESALER